MSTLQELLGNLRSAGVDVVDRPDDPAALGAVEVDSVTADSRTVVAGSLFVARAGSVFDGHEHIDAAVRAGAVAVIAERSLVCAVPLVVVNNSSKALGVVASVLAGSPSNALDVVGVTGTNGKTSIVTMIETLATASGSAARSIGTLTNSLTTPDAVAFQALLAQAQKEGATLVAAEVSSHALDQFRVAGTRFAVAVFTNLTQDHLDYHVDMEGYFAAKAMLFSREYTDRAVIDCSDTWGRRLAEIARARGVEVLEVDGAALVESASCTSEGASFEWRGHPITIPVSGAFNVVNAVLAAEACVAIGRSVEDLVDGLGSLPQVPGRFEWIREGQDFGVIVDYSHTPASVEAAIASARALTADRVIVVFGAAGDRDPGKRPLMARAAAAADIAIVTSDNPRSEDPAAIIDDVVAGFADAPATPARIEAIIDRRDAIRSAVAEARPGDIVLIAGKGHEDYQIVGAERLDFDDRVEARSALADLEGVDS